MFTLPQNTAAQVRTEVVNHIVRAMFKAKHMSYCDWFVFIDEEGGFYSHYGAPTTRPIVEFTPDERNAAFDEFKQKGYHILKSIFYVPRTVWSYQLREVKSEETHRDDTWLF